jgi:hypothetical protein
MPLIIIALFYLISLKTKFYIKSKFIFLAKTLYSITWDRREIYHQEKKRKKRKNQNGAFHIQIGILVDD